MPPKPPIHVFDLHRFKRGWSFTVEFHRHGQGMKVYYCTGPDGVGLWVGKRPGTLSESCIAPELVVPSHHQGALKVIRDYFANRGNDG